MRHIAEKIYLASNSPRRLQLLQLLNIFPDVLVPSFDENIPYEPNASDYAVDIALGKLRSITFQETSGIVISADTVVQLSGQYLGKPENLSEAETMLRSLSGNWHEVVTGCAVKNLKNDNITTIFESTRVHFRVLRDSEITDYAESGLCFDKAGAYGIQDPFGAVFVDRIEGDFYNVMGLPISRLYSTLLSITA